MDKEDQVSMGFTRRHCEALDATEEWAEPAPCMLRP